MTASPAVPRSVLSMELRYYVSIALMSSDVKRGLFVIYLLGIGIEGVQFGVLQAALFISNLVLEVPTGLLADRLGRRTSMLIGMGMLAVNGTGYLFFHSFAPFLLLFIVTGAGFALASGADQALLYDNLKAAGRTDRFLRVNSYAQAISALSLGASIFVGGLLQFHYSWTVLFVTGVVIRVLATVSVALLPEHRLAATAPANDVAATGPPALTGARAMGAFFRSRAGRAVLPLIFGAALLNSVLTPYYIYAQSFLVTAGLTTAFIGATYAVAELGTAAFYVYAHRVANRFPFRRLTLVTFGAAGALVFTTALVKGGLLVAALFVVTTAVPAVFVAALSSYLNDRYPSETRAACISVENLVSGTAVAIAYVVFGAALEHWTFATVLPFAAGVIVVAWLICELSFVRRIPGAEPIPATADG